MARKAAKKRAAKKVKKKAAKKVDGASADDGTMTDEEWRFAVRRKRQFLRLIDTDIKAYETIVQLHDRLHRYFEMYGEMDGDIGDITDENDDDGDYLYANVDDEFFKSFYHDDSNSGDAGAGADESSA